MWKSVLFVWKKTRGGLKAAEVDARAAEGKKKEVRMAVTTVAEATQRLELR